MANTWYVDYENGNDAEDGSTWAKAWKTFTDGATAARIAAGDTIRIAKSPAPVSIGSATWTNLSKTVTLAGAQTLTIDNCETAWTTGGDKVTPSSVTSSPSPKEGTYCAKFVTATGIAANTLQAYYTLNENGGIDYSSYQKISLWFYNYYVAVNTGNYVIALCSDTAGATPVDTFLVPAIPSASRWQPLTLTKVGGGNLGSAIKSIALYTGADVTGIANSRYIGLDNIIACTTNGLNLQSLISKNSAEQGGTESWYGIQSIDGVTVLLDNDVGTASNSGKGYYGETESVTTYKRETIKTDMVASAAIAVQSVMDSGSAIDGNIQFQGGYDTGTNEQTGETFFDGLNGHGYGLYLSGKYYITLNHLNACRYYTGVYYASSYYNTIINLISNNNAYGVYYNSSSNNTIITITANNGNTGVNNYKSVNNIITTVTANNNIATGVYYYIGSNNHTITTVTSNNNNNGVYYNSSSINNTITNVTSNNNNYYGIYCNSSSINNTIRTISTTGNGTAGICCDATSAPNYFNNALIAEETEISFTPNNYSNLRVYSTNHDQDTTKHWVFTDGGTINSEDTDRDGGTGIMWKLAITTSNRASLYPLKLPIAKIACVANKLVTVNAYMKKSHASNVGAMLVCPGGQLTGMTAADITDTKADDADWEELSISFTPTQAGVVEIEAWAWYVAGNANVYVEDLTITQAD